MHHQKSVLCKDGLPKLKDFPKELGGSGARDSRMILTRRSVVVAGGMQVATLQLLLVILLEQQGATRRVIARVDGGVVRRFG